MPDKKTKRSLRAIREQTFFDGETLANNAEVTLLVVYKMLVGDPVLRWQAEKVLQSLSEMTGGSYSLDTVEIVLLPDPETSV